MSLLSGQVLQNRYRVVSLLRKGGMEAVYRAWDTRLNVAVALKGIVPPVRPPSVPQPPSVGWA